jgi:hypothetical protein
MSRRAADLQIVECQRSPNAVVNLASRSQIRNLNAVTFVVRRDDRVAGLLDSPRTGRVGGDTGKAHLPLPSSTTNYTYSRWRNTVSTVKLVARPYAGRLAAQERPPGRGMSSAGSMPWARNLPDRGHDTWASDPAGR